MVNGEIIVRFGGDILLSAAKLKNSDEHTLSIGTLKHKIKVGEKIKDYETIGTKLFLIFNDIKSIDGMNEVLEEIKKKMIIEHKKKAKESENGIDT